jgi:hypothetical protein
MSKKYYCPVGAATAVAILLTLVTAYKSELTRAQSSQGRGDEARAPVLDYEAEVKTKKSSERREKDKRFDGRGGPGRPITEFPPGAEPLPSIAHWWVGLPALPAAESDAVILGTVIDQSAHLSDNKTGIYSEFIVRVEEVFKDAGGSAAPGSSLTVTRVGGGVRFPSGKIQQYAVARQGTPQQGRHYVLFIKRGAGDDLMILTGYELSDGRVTPLDGEDDQDPRSALPFSRYRGVSQAEFLRELCAALSNSARAGEQ